MRSVNILEVKDLSVSVDGKTILSDVTFNVTQNQTVVIIGVNGSGKTLLLKTLMGFSEPLAGMFKWKEGIKIGYVPQKLTIEKKLPLTVNDFVKLKIKNISLQKIVRALEDVGLKREIGEKSLGNLSGGQFQRALIAWAIVDNPDVLIFDEPTESIDPIGQASLYELIDNLKKKKGIGVFIVSHDLDILENYADKVLCLAKGKLICYASPGEVKDKIPKVYHH